MRSPDDEPHDLTALLNVLLPGTHGFPCAGKAGVVGAFVADKDMTRLAKALVERLDASFNEADLAAKDAAVAALETTLGEAFHAFVAAAYAAYYSSPTVLGVISSMTGYRHPPQPVGYALAAFDESILETARRNPPSWRNVSSKTSCGS